MLTYRLLDDGAFVVVSHATRNGSYAYPSSPHAEAAKRSIHATALKVAVKMAVQPPNQYREEHYLRCCELLRIEPDPVPVS